MHEYWQSLIPDYISDDLSEIERHTLEAHLKNCSECRQVLAEWRIIAHVTKSKTQARNRPLPPLRNRFDGTNPSGSQLLAKAAIKETIDMTTLPVRQTKSSGIPWTAVAVLLLTFFFSLMLLGGLDLQPVQLPQGQGLGDIPEDPVELFQLYLDEVWNKQNMDAIPQLLSENHIHHDASMSEDIVGLNAFAEYAAFEHDVLPDVTFAAENLVTNGNTVMGKVTMTYEDFAKTILVNATITNGKLAETWFDVGTMTEAYNHNLHTRFWEVIDSSKKLQSTDFDPFIDTRFVWHNPAGTNIENFPASDAVDWVNEYNDVCKFWEGGRVLTVQHNFITSQSVGTCLFDTPINWGVHLLPTNERMDVETVWIWRIQDGQFVENWWYLDEPWLWAAIAEILASPRTYSEAEEMYDIFDINSPIVQTRAIAQRYVDEIWNAEELDGAVFEELYAPRPQFAYHPNTLERIEQATLIELHTAIREAFADSQLTVVDMIVGDGKAVIQFTWTGTHTAIFEYQDIVLPPTNEVVETSGMIVLKIVTFGPNSRITHETWYVDFPFLVEFEQITEG